MYGSESSSDGGWISWFIELEGHEFFVEVSGVRPRLFPLVFISNLAWLNGRLMSST